MSGLSTIGNISFGLAFVAGKKRVPRPATGNTAVRISFVWVTAHPPLVEDVDDSRRQTSFEGSGAFGSYVTFYDVTAALNAAVKSDDGTPGDAHGCANAARGREAGSGGCEMDVRTPREAWMPGVADAEWMCECREGQEAASGLATELVAEIGHQPALCR